MLYSWGEYGIVISQIYTFFYCRSMEQLTARYPLETEQGANMRERALRTANEQRGFLHLLRVELSRYGEASESDALPSGWNPDCCTIHYVRNGQDGSIEALQVELQTENPDQPEFHVFEDPDQFIAFVFTHFRGDALFARLQDLASTEQAVAAFLHFGLLEGYVHLYGDIEDFLQRGWNIDVRTNQLVRACMVMHTESYDAAVAQYIFNSDDYRRTVLPSAQRVTTGLRNEWTAIERYIQYDADRRFVAEVLDSTIDLIGKLYPDRVHEEIPNVVMRFYRVGAYANTFSFYRTGNFSPDELGQAIRDYVQVGRAVAVYLHSADPAERMWVTERNTLGKTAHSERIADNFPLRLQKYREDVRVLELARTPGIGGLNDVMRRFLLLTTALKIHRNVPIEASARRFNAKYGTTFTAGTRQRLIRQLLDGGNVIRGVEPQRRLDFRDLVSNSAKMDVVLELLEGLLLDFHVTGRDRYTYTALYDISDYSADNVRRVLHALFFPGVAYAGDTSAERIRDLFRDQKVRDFIGQFVFGLHGDLQQFQAELKARNIHLTLRQLRSVRLAMEKVIAYLDLPGDVHENVYTTRYSAFNE